MSISTASNIDEEWKKFISIDYDNDSDDDLNKYESEFNEEFISANLNENLDSSDNNIENDNFIPTSSEIYISTKTKIAYLNKPIDLKYMFWSIPVIKYMEPKNGVIKKQMKFNSNSEEEIEDIKNRLKNENHYDEQIITSINNPSGRIKFKDIRKITIGLSKKDIMSYRSKKKSAFYNCFVLILRIKVDTIFKEFHVKIFNTGKLEIPGIQNDHSFNMILKLVLETLQPHTIEQLCYKENTCETVLINSNFNCGFYINREALYDILRYKYNIQSIYDPCSYPGIQCKFYFNPDVDIQNGCQISQDNKELYKNVSQVSFMIFRTGSVLIVGKCDENVLILIYEFLKSILLNEYRNICQKNTNNDKITDGNQIKLDKKKKIRRKNILITVVD
jgi:TATA-box binding protein (TBP) (component of TFIID and TFIIIB)